LFGLAKYVLDISISRWGVGSRELYQKNLVERSTTQRGGGKSTFKRPVQGEFGETI